MAIECYLYQYMKRAAQLCFSASLLTLGLSECKPSTNRRTSATHKSRVDSKLRCLDPDLSFSTISLTSFTQSDYAPPGTELCRKNSFEPVDKLRCLVCPDAWFLSFVKKEPIAIPAGDPSQGVWVQTHMLGRANLKRQRALHTPIRACVLKDGSDNIVTADVDRTRALLPLWKRALRQRAGITQAYINQHICISKTEVHPSLEKNRPWFTVNYTLNVDWAEISTADSVVFPEKRTLNPDSLAEQFSLELTHPINKIVSRSTADQLLKTCHNSLSIENMRYKSMDHQGRLRIVVWQKNDSAPNKKNHRHSKHELRYHKTWRAELDLESGKIESCDQVSTVASL